MGLDGLVAGYSGGGMAGLGSGYQFFQFALDVGAGAEHLGGEDAVRVDGEVVRDGLDAEGVAEAVIGVAVLDPGHLVLVEEGLPFGFVAVPADASGFFYLIIPLSPLERRI
jgi:hypothetical protein